MKTIPMLLAQAGGLQAIHDANGFGIAITGMLIVFVALIVISLFIRILPEVLNVLDPFLPEMTKHQDMPVNGTAQPGEDQRMVAAIGYVLHEEMKKTM